MGPPVIKAVRAYFASPRREAWGTLTQAQIAVRCRARAEAAIAHAEGSPDASGPLLETAEAWMQLADDIEWAAEKTAASRSRTAVAAVRQLGKVT
jgi:hypothetical protein